MINKTKLISPQKGDIYIGKVYPVKIKVLKVDKKYQKVLYLDMDKNSKFEVGLAMFKHLQITKYNAS